MDLSVLIGKTILSVVVDEHFDRIFFSCLSESYMIRAECNKEKIYFHKSDWSKLIGVPIETAENTHSFFSLKTEKGVCTFGWDNDNDSRISFDPVDADYFMALEIENPVFKPSYKGSVYIRQDQIPLLPENFYVGSSLFIQSTDPIEGLPEGINVDTIEKFSGNDCFGVCSHFRADFKSLPKHATFRHELVLKLKDIPPHVSTPRLYVDPSVTKLPTVLEGVSCLFLDSDSPYKLPDGFTLLGDLSLDGPIEELPEGLQVHDLVCHKTQITKIPSSAVIGGSLTVTGESFKELPAAFTVPGDVQLARTSIESIPEDFSVGGSLTLIDNAALKEIKKGIRVGKDFEIRGSGTTFPPNFSVSENAKISCDKGKTVLGDNTHIGKNLSIYGLGAPKKFPKNLFVGRSLTLGEKLASVPLPEDCHVGKRVYR